MMVTYGGIDSIGVVVWNMYYDLLSENNDKIKD